VSGVGIERQDAVNYYGYKSINDMVSAECTPLVDMLLKLSSIASNFASAANNTKNVTISDKHEVNELLDLVFDVRRLSEKVEKVVEERIDMHLEIICSGVFEHIKHEDLKEEAIVEALVVGAAVKAGLNHEKK
jgi:hypothetical protein